MIKEIDLRALINNNLKSEEHDVSPVSLGLDETINLKERTFEKDKKWNKKEKTNYIESIFLSCALQPIIRFKNNNHIVIVDGYNRYLTIKSFYNNELVLNEQGLNQLKFLSDKKYEDLSQEERNFFNKNACLKVIDYSCELKLEEKKYLTEEEELEVLKYLYTIYNTGLKLEIEEIQNAQFYDDCITTEIRNKINKEYLFLDVLEKLKLYNGKRERNKIENILLNCRLLISSTYSNIYNFSYTQDIQTRIEENYLPNIDNLNKNKIFNDFIININQIYNGLINTQKWQNYPNLNCKPFIEATYWLISVIRKDNLIDPFSFDFMKYLDYFGQREEAEKNFDIYHAHYSKNIYKKFLVVSKYFENEYNIKMSKYFDENAPKNNGTSIIKDFAELYRKDFNFTPEKIKISSLLVQLKNSSNNLRPYYQRKEVMNASLSSKIIESILLGINIPYILTCDRLVENNYVTEVVDGQQRLLSILGMLESPFMNQNGELEYSNKNGYSLKNLRILNELNGLSFKGKKKDKSLSIEYINKILNSNLCIYKTKEVGDNGFNTIDRFVRLNKKATLIKENSYRMMSLTSDKTIIDCCIKASQEFLNDILPKPNKNGKPYLIMLRLSYLFYNKLFDEINYSEYRNVKVSNWLNEFNKFKDKNFYSNQEEIEKFRFKYLNSINETKKFLTRISKFLEKNDRTMETLVCVNNSSQIPLSYYYYVFCLLGNLSEDTLINKSDKIYNIVNTFFSEIKDKNIMNKELLPRLEFYVNQIKTYDINKIII